MNKGTDLILITGATGQQGGAVAESLLAAGHKIRALTRNPDSPAAQALAAKGAEVVKGDYEDEASVKAALAGAWGAFAVQNTWEAGVEGEERQGKRFAELAKEAGVQHFVYTSVASAHRNTGIPHFDNKFRVEETVRGLGFPSFTIVRPVYFMENITSPWVLPGLQEGNLAVALEPGTSVQMISVKDIGEYGRWAFENHEALNGRALDIAGDSTTMPDAAKTIADAAGRPIQFYKVPIEDVRSFSDDFAIMLEWFDAVGYNADIDAMSKESGITPTRFDAWVKSIDWAEKLSGAPAQS